MMTVAIVDVSMSGVIWRICWLGEWKVKSSRMKASGWSGTWWMDGCVRAMDWLSWHHSLLRAPVTRPRMIQSRIERSRESSE